MMEDVSTAERNFTIVLYNINSMLCKVIKRKLKEKQINFTNIENCDIIIEEKVEQVPAIKCGEKLYQGFKKSLEFINNLER